MTTTATERVGRYQLLEPIGHGPSGRVSRAKVFGVAGFERQFAIKRFHTELTTGATAQALSTAARAYGGLEHPRIARMSEFGIAQGTTFTAVELVPGLDALRLVTEVRLGNGVLAAGGALALVSQAARAVGYAHGRGLTHLGLAPTNVLITAEGDVKITDFGILAATLPPRPTEVARLAGRLCYLAPEQLANEATSAATDVFALGVLAYELITGKRVFEGDSPQAIAAAVGSGPPADPSLPKPILRVLQRCLARSPFERFPDARALADALDAALRVAPVPGTRKDIGAQVKQILDRLADLHSGELSGMLSFNVGSVPGPAAKVAALGAANRDSGSELDVATMEFVRPDTPVAGPAPLVGPKAEPPPEHDDDPVPTLLAKPPPRSRATPPPLPVIKAPLHTVPGLAPPPIAVPPQLASAGLPLPAPPPPPSQLIPKPLVGAVPPPKPGQGPTKPVAVQLDPPERPSESPVSPLRMMQGAPSGTAPAVPIARIPPRLDGNKQIFGALRPDNDAPDAPRTDLVIETDPGDLDFLSEEPAAPEPSLSVEMEIVHAPPEPEAAAAPIDRPTTEMERLERDALARRSARRSDEHPAWRPSSLDELSAPQDLPEVPAELVAPEALVERKTIPGLTPAPSLSRLTPPSASFMQQPERNVETMDVRSQPPARGKGRWILVGLLGLLALGAGGFVIYNEVLSSDGGGTATAPADAAVVATAADAAVRPADTAATAADAADEKPADAATAVATDAAAVADARADVPTGPADTLAITSNPAGARVFLDGADSGVTPLKLPGTPDKHNIVLLLPGHELYVAKGRVGNGKLDVTLKEVTPPGGPAGIKVVKCKDKDRYYVFVDGKPTGMTCPTERIEVQVGDHTVEVYDTVTETQKSFPVPVKDTRLSVRVRVEP